MIPVRFQPFLWSEHVQTLDPERDAGVIIHRLLAYGNMEAIRWLFARYGRQKITRTFLREPMNMYTKSSFHFTKNILLGLADEKVTGEQYVKIVY